MTTGRAPNANPAAGYQRVAQHYRDQIDSGNLNPGDQLPIVEKVAEEHNVSRTTAHKAMIQLTQEKYTHSYTGGTYVLMAGADRLFSVLEELLNAFGAQGQELVLGPSEIRSKGGAVVRNTETGRWEKVSLT